MPDTGGPKKTVDNCRFAFDQLVAVELPKLLENLKKSIQDPKDANYFIDRDITPKRRREDLKLKKNAGGLYLFMKDGKPFYVGITRDLLTRLKNHLNGEWDNNATLAFSMARHKWLADGGEKKDRKVLMSIEEFKPLFKKARTELHGSKVALVEIDDPVTLYLFEVYCAMHFNTYEWNTFKTH
jgi:predicted GIY-YIG superfamily endonuclease